jgi:hypothetical protein
LKCAINRRQSMLDDVNVHISLNVRRTIIRSSLFQTHPMCSFSV